MGFKTEWISYGSEKQYTGFLAYPERVSSGLPAVLVLQEIWGVDEHIQDLVLRYAQAGYAAIAPDLYAKNGERTPELASGRISEVKSFLDSVPPSVWHSMEDRDKALNELPAEQSNRIRETFGKLMGGTKSDLYLKQLTETTQFLRNENEVTKGQSAASVGFCMGGALSAALACTDPELKGAVIYYGTAPAEEKIAGIRCKLLGFYGQMDSRISDAVPHFAEAMEKQGKSFESHVYEGAQHAFFNDTRASYHVKAARDSFARTISFFNEVL